MENTLKSIQDFKAVYNRLPRKPTWQNFKSHKN